ncbi:MAG: LuxR C-terminal-related transcriptional regulator [Syntrophaceticus sp.]|jgi:transcriptional regulator of acetoin/glycerol metabolism|nr:LuxR C-terminal-related transcriptional regulator [Syntrophaceticus sp.]MDD4359455.1 LuxR C-terminal-related transcriptional regulator [Syntrophaceticus sp.]
MLHLKACARLLDLTDRLIAPLSLAGTQKHYIYILCDPKLVTLKIFATQDVLVATKEVGVKPGTVFTRESCGTNALALAREHGRLVAVRGEQHYCRLFKDWCCVASPLKDPEDKILGYLDISMHAEKELGLAVPHLKTLTTLIEREFMLMVDCCQDRNAGASQVLSRIPSEVAVKLTAREHDVLSLLLFGLSSKETATKLHLSVYTVEGYRKQIYQKLGVKGGVKGILALLSR